jgi:16S rRNA (uracil1498-N3)-methyltransferase
LARYDFRTTRLFVAAPLTPGARIVLDQAQANYLLQVLRHRPGDGVLVFNGRDGEWRAMLAVEGRKQATLAVGEQTRPQPAPGDLHYLFAPLKHARLDYMVQKAVEMGATRLQPVRTQHTQAERVNLKRMRANAIEAAQQCGILTLPDIGEPVSLADAIADFEPSRLLVFCDEEAEVQDLVAALAAAAARPPDGPAKLAVLIGPEGGFSETERAALLKLPRVVRLALGPRILRADTAAVAALALVGAVMGDWR